MEFLDFDGLKKICQHLKGKLLRQSYICIDDITFLHDNISHNKLSLDWNLVLEAK